MPSRRVTTKTTETRESADRRAYSVIVEAVRSQMAIVLEAVTSSRAELQRGMAEMEARLSARITALEQAVRQNSEDIRDLREEMTRLRHDFDHRAERGRLASLEERVAAIETRMGRTA